MKHRKDTGNVMKNGNGHHKKDDFIASARQEMKPFTEEECRLAYRTPNPEFDALEHHCASLPKRQFIRV
jgi:hypothetical protein